MAIRECQRKDAEELFDRFGRLDYTNLPSILEWNFHGDSIYALVDDVPLELTHVVSYSMIYPAQTKLELSTGMCLNPHNNNAYASCFTLLVAFSILNLEILIRSSYHSPMYYRGGSKVPGVLSEA